MSLNRSINTVKHLPRYREVANVFIKYGFASVYDRLNLPFINRIRRADKVEERLQQKNAARRLRAAFEELGPTFIKMGQLLSTRADWLNPEFIKELENLQDNVPSFAFAEVSKILGEEGIDIHEQFSYFNPQPIAAASIGQVHEAILISGEKVVVKVKRPGIDEMVKTDLEILREISVWLERRIEWIRFYKLSEVIDELGQALVNELDFEKEARNIEIFHRNFGAIETVIIPAVFWAYSSKRVVTMEYVEGIKISDFASLKQNHYDTRRIASNIVKALFFQIYVHGFFHADPHPGNMAVSSGEKIIFYDFGQVGVIDEYDRDKYMILVIGMMNHDVTGVTRVLLEIADNTNHVSVEELRRDVANLSRKYYGMPLSQINIGEALAELIDLSAHYRVRLPAELSLLVKMLMTIESTISLLDPTISLVDIAEPYGKRALKERYSGKRIKHEIGEILMDYGNVARTMPRDISNIFKKVMDGQLTIRMEHHRLETLGNKLDLISNRLSLAIILASLIIGTSLFVNMSGSSIVARIPIAELGFILAVILGLFLAYSILRSGRF
ncbi:ubiquinone biosynthesis monooxygenase ubib [hydrocarbon metagenome]|uniref:Ubiquinone biosynthesis monooxygenase ubib n=1 Tax=hydrocarbon metagenome TaxID=938273 RepID=A0A0W8E3D9_9ZZZZ